MTEQPTPYLTGETQPEPEHCSHANCYDKCLCEKADTYEQQCPGTCEHYLSMADYNQQKQPEPGRLSDAEVANLAKRGHSAAYREVTDYPGDTARILLSFAAEILTARATLAALQAEITDLRDRDAAEQRYAMGRDYAALPTVDPQADGDTQVKQAVAECACLSQQLAEREAKRGTYLDARGIAPRQPGQPKPEEVIRRMRDEGEDDVL